MEVTCVPDTPPRAGGTSGEQRGLKRSRQGAREKTPAAGSSAPIVVVDDSSDEGESRAKAARSSGEGRAAAAAGATQRVAARPPPVTPEKAPEGVEAIVTTPGHDPFARLDADFFGTTAGKGKARTRMRRTALARRPAAAAGDAADPARQQASWLDRYVPQRETDLVIRPAKIREFRKWVEGTTRALARAEQHAQPLCILSGPSGVGKTTLVRVVARSLALVVNEFDDTPTQRFVKGNRADVHVPYESRVAAFRRWLAAGSSFTSLAMGPQAPAAGAPARQLLLLDMDAAPLVTQETLPAYRQAMHAFVARTASPMVVILDENVYRNFGRVLVPDLLESTRSVHVKMNPMTNANVKKALRRILAAERLAASVDPALLDDIAEASHGDLRQAIHTAHLHSLDRSATAAPVRGEATADPGETADERRKQRILPLFHGLGKLLNAKREPGTGRLVENVEDVLTRAGATSDATYFNGFLQQNCIEYFEDVEDLDRALDQLSLADVLAAGDVHAAAASVGARGIVTYNVHRAPNKFRPVRRPKSRQLDVARAQTADQCRAYLITGCRSVIDAGGDPAGDVPDSMLVRPACHTAESLARDILPFMDARPRRSGYRPSGWADLLRLRGECNAYQLGEAVNQVESAADAALVADAAPRSGTLPARVPALPATPLFLVDDPIEEVD